MHRSPSRFVSARSRGSRPGPAHRLARTLARPHRRALEALEGRVLFAAGDFDLTFGGGDGAALVDFGASTDIGTTVVPLAGGKSLVGGSVGSGRNNVDDVFGIARLNADGTLDTTFGGGDGLATLDFGPDADLNSMAVAPSGRIVAVGRVDSSATGTASDWAVAVFNADGTPDTTFGGGDGMIATDFFAQNDSAWGVDVQPDGKYVVTGVAQGLNNQIIVVRYNADGSPDTTFDIDGRVSIDFFNGGNDFASAIRVQPDLKIILVGSSVQPGSYRQFVLARLNPDGSLDTSFDGDGQANADFGAQAWAKDVEIQSDGKYVVGGWVDTNPVGDDQLDFAVARFNSNGSPDTSFGTLGRTVFTGTGGDANNTYGLEIQQNGKILLGGTTKDASGHTFAGVARLNINGTPDTTFGPGGLRQFTIPGTAVGTSTIGDLEEQPDGSILLAGTNGTDFAVVKLQNDDGPPPVPGSISGVVYNDANQNGVRDAGEAGLPGWRVYQDLNTNGIYDAGPVTVSSTDVPKVLPERGTPPIITTSTLSAANLGGTITDLNVNLDINHSWDADLIVTLISPSGKEVVLFDTVGGGGKNFKNTVLDDEAAQSISAGDAPFTGTFRPEQPLSGFDGLDPNGIWTLKIADQADFDAGTLNSWSLVFTTTGEPSVVTGIDGSYNFPSVNPGTYSIREVVQTGWTQTAPATGAQIVDVGSGQAVTGRDFGNVNLVIPAAVVGRSVFYNNSSLDGHNPGADAADDAAIATDKQALLPGQTASFANVTSYAKGINGVMIDMTRMTSNLEADDFDFRMGNTANPGLWIAAPAPLSITERPSGRADGATRVSIAWADNLIRNQWLQVTVRANSDTRLASQDVFYFGNLVGETVNNGTVFKVDASDVLATRNAPRGTATAASAQDHNRDRRVDVRDEVIVRDNVGATLSTLAAPAAASFGDAEILAAIEARRLRAAPVARSVLG